MYEEMILVDFMWIRFIMDGLIYRLGTFKFGRYIAILQVDSEKLDFIARRIKKKSKFI